MKTQLFENWDKKFQLMFLRFPFALLFIVGTAILCCLQIQNYNVKIDEKVWAFFIVGVFLNIAMALLLEDIKSKIYRYLIGLLIIGVWALYCFTLPKHLQPYLYYQVAILGGVSGFAIFFASYLKKNNEVPFWNFSRKIVQQLFISYFFAAVLMGGISLAIFSIHELFHANISSKTYNYLFVACFVLFAPIYFLTTVPNDLEKRSTEITVNKLFKILGLYILLPILTVYTLILYAYLIQIIFKWELPNGWVSTLVSVLGLGGFITTTILFPLRIREENRVSVLLSRYFPVVLFPLLVLMLVGIVRRFDDYGITINRGYVLILNVWLFGISAYQFFIKGKKIKWIFISFALVAFIVSVGPWSVSSLTRHSLNSLLVKELTNSHLIHNGKLIQPLPSTVKIDTLSERKIVSCVQYLHRNYGTESLQPIFGDSIKEKSSSKILAMIGIDEEKTYDRIYGVDSAVVEESGYFFNAKIEDNKQPVPLSSYHYLLKINGLFQSFEDSHIVIKRDGNTIIIKMKGTNTQPVALALEPVVKMIVVAKEEQSDLKFSTKSLTVQKSNCSLIINRISGDCNRSNGKIKITNLEADLLY